MFKLDGKTALVTGATGGIGSAIARLLHAQGAKVVLSGTREAVLQKQAEELGEGRAFYVAANLSDPAEADGLIAKAEEAAGAPIDILVNNAGLTRDMLALRMKDEDWDQVLNVDLSSPFRLCRAALKACCAAGQGVLSTFLLLLALPAMPGRPTMPRQKLALRA